MKQPVSVEARPKKPPKAAAPKAEPQALVATGAPPVEQEELLPAPAVVAY
jgi:hypothetical protein